jgi:flagellar hook protein FlgE
MFNSFSAALSALRAHSVAVDTTGHNLANVNTAGFKACGVAFKDLVAESMSGGRSETGMGVSRPLTVRNFTQGAVQSTSGSLDAAIQGSGFFVVREAGGSRLLTRDGSFQVNPQGFVTTLTGERVQQYVNGTLADIQIPSVASGASATTTLGITANVNSATAVGESFTTPVEVVDSLGVTHVLTFKFTKAAANSWNYDVLIPRGDLATPPAGTDPLVSIFSTAPTDTIDFDANGRLTAPDSTPGTIDLPVAGLADSAADLAIKWNFYDAAGQPRLTQFAQASAPSSTTQDGYPSSEIVSVGMVDGGRINARYGNGEQKEIATLAIALVSNPSSLAAASNNNFRVSADTAKPTYGVAETGGRGKVKAEALEASTVDIAREFTNLIVYQRGYQANSRVITTADELSQETLSLKR